MLQQPALSLDAAAIAGQRSVRSNHSMARHHHSNRIRPIRQSNRPHCSRIPNPLGQLAIRDRRPTRNLTQRPPHLLLKLRPRSLHRNAINRSQITREVALHYRRHSARISCRFQAESILAIVMHKHRPQCLRIVRKVRRAQITPRRRPPERCGQRECRAGRGRVRELEPFAPYLSPSITWTTAAPQKSAIARKVFRSFIGSAPSVGSTAQPEYARRPPLIDSLHPYDKPFLLCLTSCAKSNLALS